MSMAVVQPMVVQSNLSSGGTISLPSNVTEGNHSILTVIHSSTITLTITDSLGNTATQRVSGVVIGSNRLYEFTIPIASTGASTITITYSGGTARRVYLREVSGLDTSVSPLTASNDANTANPVTSGSVTPTRDGSLVSSFFFHNGGAAFTAGSSLTERHDSGGHFVQDGIQATAATINPQATAASSPATAVGVTVVYTPVLSGELVFDDQPSNSWTGEVVRPPVVINITTDGSTVNTGATDTVDVELASGSGTLSGTVSAAAVAGVATFSNLIVTGAGVHSLSASVAGYDTITSNTFKVATGTGGGGGGGTLINGGLIS